ncbi:MAG: GntR family transcriptional regulator, partial [Leptolyngbya sp. SIO4C1]|nr:GntR family transcriptional regulator [Leptolyngbya sp. SIO4C1]
MDLPVVLEASSAAPLYRQLYEQLRQAILQGRLRSQQRLPSTRSLAQSLGVSRMTVTQSYDQLISEGYLETRPGAGTYVCQQLPETLLQSQSDLRLKPVEREFELSDYGQRVARSLTRVHESDCEISFRYGRPALDCFPTELWRQLLARACRSSPSLQTHSRASQC